MLESEKGEQPEVPNLTFHCVLCTCLLGNEELALALFSRAKPGLLRTERTSDK